MTASAPRSSPRIMIAAAQEDVAMRSVASVPGQRITRKTSKLIDVGLILLSSNYIFWVLQTSSGPGT